MIAWGPRLLQILQGNTENNIRNLALAIKNSRRLYPSLAGGVEFDEEGLRQIVDGYTAMIAEALAEQDPPEIFNTYFEAIVPGVLSGGENILAMIHVGVGMSVFVSDQVAREVDPSIRDEVIRWLSNWFGKWVAALAAVKQPT